MRERRHNLSEDPDAVLQAELLHPPVVPVAVDKLGDAVLVRRGYKGAVGEFCKIQGEIEAEERAVEFECIDELDGPFIADSIGGEVQPREGGI